MSTPTTIGNQEWCAFDELQIPAIKARIDSGAKTSSIQAVNIKRVLRNGTPWAEFEVNPVQDNRSLTVKCSAKIVDTRVIKSSTGQSQKRYVIETPVRIGPNTYTIELTLASRDQMEFRMLLGRQAMQDFIIDPNNSFYFGRLVLR